MFVYFREEKVNISSETMIPLVINGHFHFIDFEMYFARDCFSLNYSEKPPQIILIVDQGDIKNLIRSKISYESN